MGKPLPKEAKHLFNLAERGVDKVQVIILVVLSKHICALIPLPCEAGLLNGKLWVRYSQETSIFQETGGKSLSLRNSQVL